MKRIISIDLARGFTVLFIPIVHCFMLYSKPKVHESGFGKFLAFIAEWPGAQVFMLLMGISFALTKQTSFKKVLLRSMVLVLFGYLLNALKFLVPYLAGGLSKDFINDIGFNNWQSFFLIGDIFHFAGLSLLILFSVRRLPEYPTIALLLTFLICFGSVHFWDLHSSNVVLNHFLILVSGQAPDCYFPLLPWLVYPLTGLAIGHYLKNTGNKVFLLILFSGSILLYLGVSISETEPTHSFYRTYPWTTMWHLGFVLCWFAMWHIISRLFKFNIVFSFLTKLSRGITLVYIIQWPLIFWLMSLIGYQRLGITECLAVSACISTAVFFSSFRIQKFNSIPNDKKNDAK